MPAISAAREAAPPGDKVEICEDDQAPKIVTRAEEYAELLGRPGLQSPRPKEQSLLVEGMDSKYCAAMHGDIEDLSTSASEECPERPRKEADSMPSLRVRRMLESLQPAKGRLDIPLEMVARLEHLVELADQVETKRRPVSARNIERGSKPF
eukprot:Skav232439  [mRNA]  locus=scaffold189:291139:297838:- [translate_table: standard]